MITVPVLQAIAEIFGLFGIGLFARHRGYVREEEIGRWSRFILDLLFPAYIFSSITEGFDPQRLSVLWPLPFLGLGLVLFGVAAGWFLRLGLPGSDPDTRRTFLHFCAVNNSAYLPIIIIRNLWGESALANLFLFNLGTTLGVWTIGIGVLGNRSVFRSLGSLVTPNLIAVLAALSVSLTGIVHFFPPTLRSIISTAGSAAVPVMLILIGSSFYRKGIIKISWPVLYASAVRLLILPVLAVLILNYLPVSMEVYRITVIVALMPVAVSSTIFTIRYGGNPDFAARTSIITTLAAAVTVPLALILLL